MEEERRGPPSTSRGQAPKLHQVTPSVHVQSSGAPVQEPPKPSEIFEIGHPSC